MKERVTAALLAMSVTMGSVCANAAAADDKKNVKPDNDTMDAAAVRAANESVSSSKNSDADKESTVYVIADANGKKTKTIVSSWLKNKDGEAQIDDDTTLSDVENTKGNEDYTVNDDGTITWNAQGNDIYYQGTSTEDLPVDVNVAYYLDGKKVTAEELDGASGRLKIRFTYKNNTAKTVKISGKNETIYKPYAMISGMIMDNDKAKNIEIDNGRVLNDGDKAIVVGIALPGLKESLGLNDVKDAEDIEIPNSVTVKADVKDFSLLTTMTVATEGGLSELGLDGIDSIDDLGDQMDELQDASTQLVDGSRALADGSATLYDGTLTLKDGSGALVAGANELDSGAGTLKDGSGALVEGASALADGTGTLASGTVALASGVEALRNGAVTVNDGASNLASGATAVADGAAQLDAGLGKLQSMLSGLDASAGQGTSQMVSGLQLIKSALKGTDSSLYAAASGIESGSETIASGANQLSSGLSSGAQSISGAADEILSYADKIASSDGTDNSSAVASVNSAKGALDGINTEGMTDEQIAQINAAKEALGTASGSIKSDESVNNAQVAGAIKQYAAGIKDGASQISGAADSASQLAAGAQKITGYAQAMQSGIDTIVADDKMGAIIAGAQAMENSTQSLVQGVNQLKNGSSQVAAGSSQVAQGASSLALGTQQLLDGANALKNGAEQAKAGSAKLDEGAKALKSGTLKLDGGVSTLKAGTKELSQGAMKLDNGVYELVDGAQTLLDGADELADGMLTFDKDGIRALTDAVNGDLKGTLNRIDALRDYSDENDTYGGALKGSDSSVKYIFKTAEIGDAGLNG